MNKMKRLIAGLASGFGTLFCIVGVIGFLAWLHRRVAPLLKIVK